MARKRISGPLLMLIASLVIVQTAAAETSGQSLFAQNCSACHQLQGQGVPGAFPALAGDSVVRGDPRAVAWLLLHGRGGMPNFSEDLTDSDIAAILTYVRSAFGNHAAPILPATVAGVRSDGMTKDPSSAVMPYH